MGKPLILAIDDDQDILYTIKAIGDHANWDVHVAKDGIKGLELVKTFKFDLVIIDYYMPYQDGMETLKKIREVDSEMPVMVLTVDESQEVAKQFMDLGANDFALKPIKAPDLISRVNLHLSLKDKKSNEIQEFTQDCLPKGLNKNTLLFLLEQLNQNKEYYSAEDISEQTGMAYPTVNRYLRFLEEEGYLDVQHEYGNIGRPKISYLLKNKRR